MTGNHREGPAQPGSSNGAPTPHDSGADATIDHHWTVALAQAQADIEAIRERRADKRWRRRFAAAWSVAIALLVVVAANAFPWGGQEWKPNEGVGFLKWQRDHGSTGKRFAANHPELAATFNGNWPTDARKKLDQARAPLGSVQIIRAVFPDNVEDYAIRIASCETGGTFDPRASGDGGNSIGLFQINYVWWHLPWVGGPERLVDPWHNSRVALRISGRGTDWTPWTCARLIG